MTGAILGIDPGLTGALAWLNHNGQLLEVRDMPVLGGEISAVLLNQDDELHADRVDVAILEWPQLMPRNGAKSARSMGMSLATITAFLTLKGIPTHRVAPGTWKRSLCLNTDKTASRALAMRLFPDHANHFMRVKDDGRAEAALIAHWWLTKRAGQESVA